MSQGHDNSPPVSGEVAALRKIRGDVKRQLTNSEKLFASIDASTDLESLNLEERLEKHRKLWDRFDSVQTQLDEDLEQESDIELETERSSFENRYHKICGLFQKYLRIMSTNGTVSTVSSFSSSQNSILNSTNSVASPAAGSSTSVSPPNVISIMDENRREGGSSNQESRDQDLNINPSQGHHNFRSRFDLPKLETPTFHGSLDTWLPFYDSFMVMCHENKDIPTIQKFLYLKSCLKDRAAEVIASLATTAENYEVAWNLLKARYDNKKYIVESHVKALFGIPKISKDFSIRALLDNFQKRFRALKALGESVDTWDTLLIFIIREKLNDHTREKWEEKCDSKKVPSLNEMISFLEHRAQFEGCQSASKLDSLIWNKNQSSRGNSNSRFQPRSSQACMATAVEDSKTKGKSACHLCSGHHQLHACSQFSNMSPVERYEIVKKTSLCHNCLLGNHRTIDCRRGSCRTCKKRHHTLLHFEKQKENEAPQTVTTSLVSCQGSFQSQVVLGTAVIDILDSQGRYQPCRAFLDSCSQCCSMTEKLVTSLGLKKNPINIQLKGAQNLQSPVKYRTSAKIKSRYDSDVEFSIDFLIFNEISDAMPIMPINRNALKIPDEIFLADPNFHKPSGIDVLIGAEHFFDLLLVGKIRVPNQTAVFQETVFGWIFSGRFSSPQPFKLLQAPSKVSCNLIKFKDLPILWDLGEETLDKPHSEEEQAAESHYIKNIKRLDSGRYEVHLPFTEKVNSLGISKNAAFQRMYALERKFTKNANLQEQYVKCLQGYLDEGHMSLISDQEALKPGYYLPHHAVIKEDSVTTKTRVVFDGSAKTSTGISLNDTFMIGPTIQEDLFAIVTRFRTQPIVLTADIEQMYRQICVSENDKLYQRILWRRHQSEPIRVYTLNTVTFGTACAPFLAIRTLHQLADDEKKAFPQAAKILKRDFYVDDLLTGAKNIQEARQLRDDLIDLLQRGGFNLRKWASNKPELCQGFSDENSKNYMSLDPSISVKALGIYWDPRSDSILYSVNLSTSESESTKRSILSQCSRLFDPLGLLGPVVVVGKIIIQQLWKYQLGWDDQVPAEVHKTWMDYKNQLPLLNTVRYQRCVIAELSSKIQIHGFCDASERAYGACLYFRSTDQQGNHHCELICSKSRVAPLKTITLPRLELCAAALLVQLYTITVRSLQLDFLKPIFWSDSTITLNWINSPPHSLMTFIANRVSEIQTATQPSDWRHVPTLDNPADGISRGQMPQDFLENPLWAHGPKWLSCHEDTWPVFDFRLSEIPEKRSIKPILSLKITQADTNFLLKYSSSKKLNRVVAYVLRFINNTKNRDKNSKLIGQLSTVEINSAWIVILRATQSDAFSTEIHALSEGRHVDPKSSLMRLTPFLDQGLLKVGGRLEGAEIPESQKHPIILPKSHHITKLIIRDEHLNKMHAGTNATLYGVRETYWPIDGRNTTRHIIRQCVTCFRAKPRGVDYLMGNLPRSRLSFTRPFSDVGVDFCGPFFTKEHRHRNRTRVKTYVSVFVCFATKAVHLELASDLTTDAFLSCLRRFFARRGLSNSMTSDNARNFLGTSNELKTLSRQLNSVIEDNKIQQYLSGNGVTWRFIPPRAPHFGGLWEAAVKSFKHHFVRIAGSSLLTYEQLHTYVVEVEAILNSRPLTPMSSDPKDYLPLTPGHFLIGSSMTAWPQNDLRQISSSRLNCWNLAQKMSQHFWERWHKEYLNEMISRSKWQSSTNQSNINIGILVVVKEDNLPPMKWKLARIIEVHPGRDGIVRAVTLQDSTSTFKRAVKILYPLPID